MTIITNKTTPGILKSLELHRKGNTLSRVGEADEHLWRNLVALSAILLVGAVLGFALAGFGVGCLLMVATVGCLAYSLVPLFRIAVWNQPGFNTKEQLDNLYQQSPAIARLAVRFDHFDMEMLTCTDCINSVCRDIPRAFRDLFWGTFGKQTRPVPVEMDAITHS